MCIKTALTAMYPLRFDDSGFPVSDQDDKPLSKSATKRLKKQLKVHKKRHTKWMAKAKAAPAASAPPQPPAATGVTTGATTDHAKAIGLKASNTEVAETTAKTTDTTANAATASPTAASGPAHAVPRVVSGTFGNRQALKFESTSGPFTHKFSF